MRRTGRASAIIAAGARTSAALSGAGLPVGQQGRVLEPGANAVASLERRPCRMAAFDVIQVVAFAPGVPVCL